VTDRHAPPSIDERNTMSFLRVIVCTTALLATVPLAHAASSGETRQGSGTSIDVKSSDGPERIGPRQQIVSGKPYLLSTAQWTEMMLKDDAVYLQLTSYGMKQVAEPQDTGKSDEGFFGNMIKSMALSGVRQLLDHSLALPLTEMRTAFVRDGSVVLVSCQGKEVFSNVKINGKEQKFPQDQAEDFVKKITRARAKLPAC
jgi:hypothetical protein